MSVLPRDLPLPKPLVLKPEVLCHPHVPKPMHGLNPRTLMGKQWWDGVRREAYRSTRYRCIACGAHWSDTKDRRLDAHEFWEIDYETCVCRVKEIVPLCTYCHRFIHSGYMGLSKTPETEVRAILEHGLQILSKHRLKCFPFTLDLAMALGCKTFGVRAYSVPQQSLKKWDDWKLIFNGVEYKSLYTSYEDWNAHYDRGYNEFS